MLPPPTSSAFYPPWINGDGQVLQALPTHDLPFSCALWLLNWREAARQWQPGGAAAVLTEAERQRALRFKFEADQIRYATCRAVLRWLLARWLHEHHHNAPQLDLNEVALPAMAPQTIKLAEGPHGKPHDAGHHGVHFNLSHSGDWALIALTNQAPIGADIEVHHPMPDMQAVAQRCFTSAENAWLCAGAAEANTVDCTRQADQSALSRFFTLWTRKEACLKALGSGLAIEPDRFEAGGPNSAQPVRLPTPCGHQASVFVASLALPQQSLGACDLSAAVAMLAPADLRLAV